MGPLAALFHPQGPSPRTPPTPPTPSLRGAIPTLCLIVPLSTGGQTLTPTLGVWHLQTFNFRVIFLAVTRADNLTPLHHPILASPVPLVMGRGPQVRGPYYPLISQERLGGLSTHKLLLFPLLHLLSPPRTQMGWRGPPGQGGGGKGGMGVASPSSHT